MPTAPLIQLPKSRSAEEFENMCADVLTMIYKIPFSSYGRSGQKQNGIDLFDNQGHHIVAQCKNYYACSYEKLQGQLAKDIASVGNLPFTVHEFIAMTSLDRDIATQNFILNLNPNFKVRILFWEDIQKEISGKPNILYKYYPQFAGDSSVPIEYRNGLISNATMLKQEIQRLNFDFSQYRPAYQYANDCAVYSMCVSVMNAMLKLYQIRQQWYIQLEEKHITGYIDKIVENMPSFYDEANDGTGMAMLYTITEFLKYFADVEKTEMFVDYCDEIISLTKRM